MHSQDTLFRWWHVQVSRAAFLFLAFAASAYGVDVQPLFSPAPQTKAAADTLKSQQDERAVSRVKLVTVDFRRVDARSGEAADALSIEAFDGTNLVLDKERVEERSVGNYTWYGTVRGYSKGRAILTVVDGHMAGSIVLLDDALQSHGIYEIVPTANGMHALQEMNQSAFQIEEPAHRHAPPQLKNSSDKPDSGKDSAGTIDIMVVYSNQTAAAAGGGIGAQIQTAIDNTNQVYANSQISQRLRLVHYEQVNYNEHGSDVYGTALDDLTGTSDGQMDNVHSLRNTYGADLVTLFIENGSYCGIGWIGSSASYAFSAVNRGCAISNNTLAHELGHNMGAMHDPYQVSVGGEGSGPYTYGYGYVSVAGHFRDIMAYDSQCQANGFSCTRIPYLSNPNITYGGLPIGTQQNDPTPTSNVARVLNTTAPTIANFRQSVVTPPPPPPPPSSIYEGVLDSADCSSIGGWAWDQNQPNGSVNLDVLSDGSTFATIPASTYRADLANAGKGNGSHGFSIATPSGLKNGQAHSISVRIAGTSQALSYSPRTIACAAPVVPPSYEGYLDGTDCQVISGWVWDQNQPNGSVNVDILSDGSTIATVSASTFRSDLLNAGKGNGNHGFGLATPAALKNSLPHNISARIAGSAQVLGTPRPLFCVAPPVVPPTYEGYLDTSDCQSISGWAWDQNQPNVSISVDILSDGSPLATVPASTFRADLVSAGKGNGVHGFGMATPCSPEKWAVAYRCSKVFGHYNECAWRA